MFRALRSDSITLHLITEDNFDEVCSLFQGFPDSFELLEEIRENYVPRLEEGRRMRYSFYATLEDEFAGVTLLEVDSGDALTGSTGADVLLHMRGKGVAPRSKPHLFYLAFELLSLNRVETGCFISNLASKKSIEKTRGFMLEGTSRQSGRNDEGQLEDEHFYAILKQDWQKLYDKSRVEVLD